MNIKMLLTLSLCLSFYTIQGMHVTTGDTFERLTNVLDKEKGITQNMSMPLKEKKQLINTLIDDGTLSTQAITLAYQLVQELGQGAQTAQIMNAAQLITHLDTTIEAQKKDLLNAKVYALLTASEGVIAPSMPKDLTRLPAQQLCTSCKLRSLLELFEENAERCNQAIIHIESSAKVFNELSKLQTQEGPNKKAFDEIMKYRIVPFITSIKSLSAQEIDQILKQPKIVNGYRELRSKEAADLAWSLFREWKYLPEDAMKMWLQRLINNASPEQKRALLTALDLTLKVGIEDYLENEDWARPQDAQTTEPIRNMLETLVKQNSSSSSSSSSIPSEELKERFSSLAESIEGKSAHQIQQILLNTSYTHASDSAKWLIDTLARKWQQVGAQNFKNQLQTVIDTAPAHTKQTLLDALRIAEISGIHEYSIGTDMALVNEYNLNQIRDMLKELIQQNSSSSSSSSQASGFDFSKEEHLNANANKLVKSIKSLSTNDIEKISTTAKYIHGTHIDRFPDATDLFDSLWSIHYIGKRKPTMSEVQNWLRGILDTIPVSKQALTIQLLKNGLDDIDARNPTLHQGKFAEWTRMIKGVLAQLSATYNK